MSTTFLASRLHLPFPPSLPSPLSTPSPSSFFFTAFRPLPSHPYSFSSFSSPPFLYISRFTQQLHASDFVHGFWRSINLFMYENGDDVGFAASVGDAWAALIAAELMCHVTDIQSRLYPITFIARAMLFYRGY